MNTIRSQAREALLRRRSSIFRACPDLDGDQQPNATATPRSEEGVARDTTEGAASSPCKDARRELVEIDAALERIVQGTYGSCEGCGGPVGRQRLRANPEARFCLGCNELALRDG